MSDSQHRTAEDAPCICQVHKHGFPSSWEAECDRRCGQCYWIYRASGITCWFHTTYVSENGTDWAPGDVVVHTYSAEETTRLLELFSNEDWEDGPRCPREILDRYDDGKPLEPHRWIVRPTG